MTELRNHPSLEMLDRWRAGLLDAGAEAELAHHVETCEQCRSHAAVWSAATPASDLHPGIAGQLRARRREVLAGRGHRARAGMPSRLLVGVAAALTLAVGVGVVMDMQGPSVPSGGVEVKAGPNLYAELDFYMWLADHQPQQDTGASANGTL